MFGALNRFISRLDAEPLPQENQKIGSDTSYGFQILHNSNRDIHLQPWFDFIVGLNGHGIDSPDPQLLLTEIRNCAGRYCSLELCNAKGQKQYSVEIPVPHDGQPLGLSLQLAPIDSTADIWHILSIPSSLSPAHQAGLLPYSDYILGSPSGILQGESALGELVEDHLNRSLTLWVYNSEFDVVREVELIPRRGWGGDGALGAVLGYGVLHRLPTGLGEEVQAPGEQMFAADDKTEDMPSIIDSTSKQPSQDAELLSIPSGPPPAPLSPPPMMNPSSAGPPRAAGAKARKTRTHAPVPGFDDMFAEGEKKSAAQDFAPSRKGTPTAPPPKPGQAPPSSQAVHTTEEIGEPGEAELT